MSKRTTKADVILADIKKRIDAVEQSHQSHLAKAEADAHMLQVLRSFYADIERTLAPKPRGKSTPAPSVEKKSSRRQQQPKLTLNSGGSAENALSATSEISSAA